jgi:hypothetical protein
VTLSTAVTTTNFLTTKDTRAHKGHMHMRLQHTIA